jgi:hypothetical protein
VYSVSYIVVIYLVVLLLPNIPEDVVMEHYVLPTHCPIKVEIDLFHFVFGLHLDKKVLVVEDGVDQQVWALFDAVNGSG